MTRRLVAISLAIFAPFLIWWSTWLTLGIAAFFKRDSTPRPAFTRFDILIPAYNEAQALPKLLASLAKQTAHDLIGSVLVVADHCTDNTAEVARSLGADVLVRSNGDNGKPLAIRDGIARLLAAPKRADAFIVIDGDCICDEEFVENLSKRMGNEKVAQGAYEIADPGSGPRNGLRLAFSLRNVVRPAGADVLGIPVGLFGSGMAFRWDVVESLSFTDVRHKASVDRQPSGTDVAIWLDLLDRGIVPVFAADARLSAAAPRNSEELAKQRMRWERGQKYSRNRARRSALNAVKRRDWRTLVALVDWSAPPIVRATVVFAGLCVPAAVPVALGVASSAVLIPPAAAGTALASFAVLGVGGLEGTAAGLAAVKEAPKVFAWKLKVYRQNSAAGSRHSTPG